MTEYKSPELDHAPNKMWATLIHHILANEPQEFYDVSKMHRELDRANQILPDKVINSILRHFPDWEYRAERTESWLFYILQRQDADPSLILPTHTLPRERRRNIYRDGSDVRITVDRVVDNDLMCLLDIESQCRYNQVLKEAAFDQAANAFHKAQRGYNREKGLFTDKEIAILGLTTYCSNNERLAEALDISSLTLGKMLRKTYKRLGIESYIDLMLIAIALEIASIHHIPEGITDRLKKGGDKNLLNKYYSPDTEERLDIRTKSTSPYGSRWSRMYKVLGVKGHHMAVLCAVKDDVLQLPSIENIQANLSSH